jgi:hypothetical protein
LPTASAPALGRDCGTLSISRCSTITCAWLVFYQHDENSSVATQDSGLVSNALEDALTALTDENVTGPEKRDLLLPIVDKVICHKDGVEVIFAPGLFSPNAEDGTGSDGELIDYTTCIVCKVQDGKDHWELCDPE